MSRNLVCKNSSIFFKERRWNLSFFFICHYALLLIFQLRIMHIIKGCQMIFCKGNMWRITWSICIHFLYVHLMKTISKIHVPHKTSCTNFHLNSYRFLELISSSSNLLAFFLSTSEKKNNKTDYFPIQYYHQALWPDKWTLFSSIVSVRPPIQKTKKCHNNTLGYWVMK